MYVYRNVEACSCKHSSYLQWKSNENYTNCVCVCVCVCVFVALDIHHAMRIRHIVICGLSRSIIIFIPHYLINGAIFEKKSYGT